MTLPDAPLALEPDIRYVIAGATGAVGKEMLRILGAAGVPTASVAALASERSAGTILPYTFTSGAGEHAENLTVQPLTRDAFRPGDVALFSCGAEPTNRLAPAAVERGAIVIDNSSAFRMDPAVPLIIPEVNAAELRRFRAAASDGTGLIANPNCSTIIALVPLEPLRSRFGIASLRVATYQAASGAGQAAMDELVTQTAAALQGQPPTPKVFREPCAFNVFSHDSDIDPETGLNLEEHKLIRETRKIWADPAARVSPTCVRVGVLRAHSEAISVELAQPATLAEVRGALAEAPGVCLVDDRAANDFPTPRKADGGDHILVGRLRVDPAEGVGERDAVRRFEMFVSGDQLRKGAALNAIQIAAALQATGAGAESE